MRIQKFLKNTILAGAALAGMIACGGQSTTSSVGGIEYTREEAAYDFVENVNRYMADSELSIEKMDTLQDTYYYDYIVVYDWVTDTYDAYDLTDYNPGENISDYLYDYDAYFYYDLDYVGNGVYEDYWTGTRFNRDSTSLNEFIKLSRQSENRKLKVADMIQTQFSINASSAQALADAYIQLTSMPKSQVSATMVENLTNKAFGFSISEVEAEVMSGNFGAIDAALETASAKTGASVESLQNTIKTQFNIDLSLLK
ncbi:MAG: hypothetical protein CL674_14945 [Bdellovibrionaceae bacterium]|nr:hypothetical protein [Pseudobdellovibrionaceae bacterium]|tara:strand:+ start:44989 stop:45756 length:768 start_codon:yes stop_codon:yes gene_type:complete